MSDDLTNLRTLAAKFLQLKGDGPWRIVITDTEGPTGIAPACTSPDHPADEMDDILDCCGPDIETWHPHVASYLVALLNAAPGLLGEVEKLRREVDITSTANVAYWETQAVIDEFLGPDVMDGACAGLAAEVRLLGEQRDKARAEAVRMKDQRNKIARDGADLIDERNTALEQLAIQRGLCADHNVDHALTQIALEDARAELARLTAELANRPRVWFPGAAEPEVGTTVLTTVGNLLTRYTLGWGPSHVGWHWLFDIGGHPFLVEHRATTDAGEVRGGEVGR